jgi:hypothetical protein
MAAAGCESIPRPLVFAGDAPRDARMDPRHPSGVRILRPALALARGLQPEAASQFSFLLEYLTS